MLIHFSEHVGKDYVRGCILEIEEMGAVVEHEDQLTFSVNVPKRSHYPFVVEFLQQEERAGKLRLDAAEQ